MVSKYGDCFYQTCLLHDRVGYSYYSEEEVYIIIIYCTLFMYFFFYITRVKYTSYDVILHCLSHDNLILEIQVAI